MVDREEPAASTAMFRAFAQRREAESTSEKGVSPLVWVAGVVVLVAVVAVVALVVS
jgi:hypothetical protein